MKKYLIPILLTSAFTLIMTLGGMVVADTKEEIAKKANNETIMKILQYNKEQRIEDRMEQKEERQDIKERFQRQQEFNKSILESIQMMLMQRVEKK